MSKDKKKVLEFKKYLNKDNPLTGKLYFGDVDHEVDQGFEVAIKLLEKKISKAINRSIEGQLWTSSGFNYKATVEDVDISLKLISKSQATMDAMGPYTDHQEYDRPMAFNFQNTPSDYLEEPDPDKSQRQGVNQQLLSDNMFSDDLSQDDRFLELIHILKEKN